MIKVIYRPEIDGLRAIAVGAVILYHARVSILGYQPFQGGFIGVDIFFVISGYLITSIILKELITTGSFSFKYFYERRIRRILPALLFVMLVSLPFAWMYLIPSSFIDFSKSILYSLGFSSNFYFHYSGQQYGADNGLFKPFLHTWSLSVEEQYYILFPVILLIIFKFFKKYLIHLLILGLILSLVLADWGSRNHPSFNFYVLPTRAWELLAGSILAYFEIIHGRTNQYKILTAIMPAVGLILIVHSVLFFKDEMFHPSFFTISPILGVCFIIWFSHKNEFVTKILSTKLFVGIGLISYSLYLWHYPIFAFIRVADLSDQDNSFFNFLILTTILFLSIISYYFIEQPFRNNKKSFKVSFVIILISVFILIFLNTKVIIKKGYKNRLPEVLQNSSNHPRLLWGLLKDSNGNSCYIDGLMCKFNTNADKKIYIIGDSHMAILAYDLKDRILKKNYQFISSTIVDCIYYPGFSRVYAKTNEIIKVCSDAYFQGLKKILSEEENAIIIFGGRFPVHFTNYYFDNNEGGIEAGKWDKGYVSFGKYDTLQKSFKNEILELSKKNKIILIYPIPEVGWDPNIKIFINRNNKFFKNVSLDLVTTSYDVYKKRTKTSFELLDSIQNNNIYRVFPHTLFCNIKIKNRCITHDEKNIFYNDDDHPSLKGAELINNLIMKEVNKILLKSN